MQTMLHVLSRERRHIQAIAPHRLPMLLPILVALFVLKVAMRYVLARDCEYSLLVRLRSAAFRCLFC